LSPFAHPRAAFRVELEKLSSQLTIRAVMVICLLGPAGFALVMRIQSTVPADTLFGRWAKMTGFATSLTVLGFAGSLGLPLLAGILAGDVFSSEDRHGTWKTVLTRSCTRADIFVGKTVAAATAAFVALAALALSSLVGGLALVGAAPLVGLSGQLVSSNRATELVLASWAYTLLPMLALVALALFLSLVSRSGIVGVLGPAVIGLAMQLLTLVGSGEIVRAVLPATPLDAWHGVFTEPAKTAPLLQGAVTSTAYIVAFLAAAWYVFKRRAFAGAWAVPQRRWLLPTRTAVAAAAVFAVLIALSDRGPTRITSGRLEAAISPTFERLVSLQYRWRTHRVAPANNAAVHVRTRCRRGSGASTGSGDDWTCLVRVVHPQVKGAAVALTVTVRSNGCFTADAPPSIVGPLLLRDTRRRTFVNPLYRFDGCFGTA
jgi:ABC-2 type transport system permease protein